MGNKTALAALTVVLLITSFSQAQLFRRFRSQNIAPQLQQQFQQQFRFPAPGPNCNQQARINNQVPGRFNFPQQAGNQTQRFVVIPTNQYQAILRDRQQQQFLNQLANRPLIERPQYSAPQQFRQQTVQRFPQYVQQNQRQFVQQFQVPQQLPVQLNTVSQIPTIAGQVVVEDANELPAEPLILPASASIPFDAPGSISIDTSIPADGPAIIPDGPLITPESPAPSKEIDPFVPTEAESVLENSSGGN